MGNIEAYHQSTISRHHQKNNLNSPAKNKKITDKQQTKKPSNKIKESIEKQLMLSIAGT